MANTYGYIGQFKTDRPGVWEIDGYVSIGESGNPSLNTVPSGIVKSVKRNSTGNYTMTLQENWYSMLYVNVKTMIPSGLSPQYVNCQMLNTNIGYSNVSNPVINFITNVSGTPTDPPAGSGLTYIVVLKNSSA